jgi:hypothetical protein
MSATFATATAAKSGGTVTANVNGVTVTMRVARDQAVAIDDVLIVERIGAQWWVLARAGETAPTPPDNPAPPDPQPVVVTGTNVIAPVETRSYRGSWRTDNTDVYQGEYAGYGNHRGCIFYGAAPASLAGATVLSATMAVRRIPGGTNAAQSTSLWLTGEATRPAGVPTLYGPVAGPSIAVDTTLDDWAIPTSWAQGIVDGTYGGLAFYEADGSPYVKFAGRDRWSPAFALTINWQRG